MENHINFVDLDDTFLFDVPNKCWDCCFTYPELGEEETTSSYSQSQETKPKQVSKIRKLSRKPKRPHLFGKKTEDYDKYWIRKFRAWAKRNSGVIISLSEPNFWGWFLSEDSEPKSTHKFKSYSRVFREYLISHPTFHQQFTSWFWKLGREETFAKFDEQFGAIYNNYAE
jgi:hypothetical protein